MIPKNQNIIQNQKISGWSGGQVACPQCPTQIKLSRVKITMAIFSSIIANSCSQAVADFAKILCTEEVHPDCLQEFKKGKLVPLDKGTTKDGEPGVRLVLYKTVQASQQV